VSGEAGFFTRCRVLRGRDHYPVRFPKVAEAMTNAIWVRDALPEFLTTDLTSVTDEVSDDLPSVATKSHPNPTLARSFEHE
jgi:hypothetical protein